MSPQRGNEIFWTVLETELDRWTDEDRTATLWWRDDDAIAETPALNRLLRLAEETPLAIAAIPAHTNPSLRNATAQLKNIRILQHGFSHTNHAPEGQKKSEFGPHRVLEVMAAEAVQGREKLSSIAEDAFCPIFVPPWNRIDADFTARLPDIGFPAVSVFGKAQGAAPPEPINVHIDLIDWRGSRKFVGEDIALGALIDHLLERRTGVCPVTEVTGLMTHHLDHDEDTWRFVERLLAVTQTHPATRWLSVETLLEDRP